MAGVEHSDTCDESVDWYLLIESDNKLRGYVTPSLALLYSHTQRAQELTSVDLAR